LQRAVGYQFPAACIECFQTRKSLLWTAACEQIGNDSFKNGIKKFSVFREKVSIKAAYQTSEVFYLFPDFPGLSGRFLQEKTGPGRHGEKLSRLCLI